MTRRSRLLPTPARRDLGLALVFALTLFLAAGTMYVVAAARWADDDICTAGPVPAGHKPARQEQTLMHTRAEAWPPGVTCEWRHLDESGSYRLGPSTPVEVAILGLAGSGVIAILAGLVAIGVEHHRHARRLDRAATRPPVPPDHP